MFTKKSKCGFFGMHPVCSMVAGALLAVGVGALILTKRHTLSCGVRRMAEAMEG